MSYFVYIICSEKHNKYYKGFSENPLKRLHDHNQGFSRYTKHFRPWTLVFLQSFDNKKEALIREKSLKKYSHAQLIELINSPLNELK